MRNTRAHRLVTGRSLFPVLALAIGLSIAATPASAQMAKEIDLSAGYLTTGSMHGGNMQIAAELTRHWSLIGEVDLSQGRDCAGCDPVYRDLAGLGGVRARWFRDARVSPFGQVLVGTLHSVAGDYYADYCCGIGRRLQNGYTVNYTAIQPGGGATIRVTPRIAIVAQADVQFAVPDQSQYEGMSIFPRIVTGDVIRLGSLGR
jgi:hypothetical protein